MIGARVTPYKEVPFDESPQGFLFYYINNREYEIKQLSEKFYLDYSQLKFPEILQNIKTLSQTKYFNLYKSR